MQPIKVWGHWGGPNPWQGTPITIRILLEELDLSYEWENVEFKEAKEQSYIQINPNGRLPSIEDPNTGITLWETAAIFLYLIEQYDRGGLLSYTTPPDKYLCQQWLAFQVSGQGPYVGQATWFSRFHAEKVQSAIDRYVNEILSITAVLELSLQRNGTGWLVGDKCTYADLSFVTWAKIGEGLLKELGRYDGFEEKFPRYCAWMNLLIQRPKIDKAMRDIAEARKGHGLP